MRHKRTTFPGRSGSQVFSFQASSFRRASAADLLASAALGDVQRLGGPQPDRVEGRQPWRGGGGGGGGRGGGRRAVSGSSVGRKELQELLLLLPAPPHGDGTETCNPCTCLERARSPGAGAHRGQAGEASAVGTLCFVHLGWGHCAGRVQDCVGKCPAA